MLRFKGWDNCDHSARAVHMMNFSSTLPPKTRQYTSSTAAKAQSLIRKALALCSKHYFLRQKYVVFQENRREPVVCSGCEPHN